MSICQALGAKKHAWAHNSANALHRADTPNQRAQRSIDVLRSALRARLRALAAYPHLTPADEDSLATKAQAGDLEARDYLALCSMRYVIPAARRYHATHPTRIALIDLIHITIPALFHAIRRHDGRRPLAVTTLYQVARALSRRGLPYSVRPRPDWDTIM